MSYEYEQTPDKCPPGHECRNYSELCELRDRLRSAERALHESLARGDRQEALIVELRDGLTRLSDKIRGAEQ